LALVAVTLIPLVVTVAVVSALNYRALSRSAHEYQVATADFAMELVRTLTAEATRELATLGFALTSERPRAEREQAARTHLLAAKQLHRFALFDGAGRFLFAMSARPDAKKSASISRPKSFPVGLLKVVQAEEWVVMAPRAPKSGIPRLPLLTALYRGESKAARGYLWAPLRLEELGRRLAELSQRRFGGDPTRIYLVDQNARVVMHAQRERIGRSLARRGIFGDLEEGINPRLDIAYSASYEVNGEQISGVLVPVPKLGLAVLVEQPAAEVFAPVWRTIMFAVFAAFVFLIAAIVWGLALGKRLSRPFTVIAAAARRVSSGDLDTPVPKLAGGEASEMADAFNGMATELKDFQSRIEKETRIRTDLSRYLSADVVENVINGQQQLALGGERRKVAILFADVVAFTPLAEREPPEKVVEVLNELFTFLTEIVFKHGGVVDKFIGDCVMALFGLPEAGKDDALRAARAAEEMLRFVETGGVKWQKQLGRNIELAIGMHWGEVIAGNVGSQKRMDYTVIGDAVNIAARLEQLAQPGQVLLTGEMAREVEAELDVESIGKRDIAGRDQPVELFELDL
jgi:adenylate cyclase